LKHHLINKAVSLGDVKLSLICDIVFVI